MRFYKRHYYVDKTVDWLSREDHHWRNIIQVEYIRITDPRELY